MSVWLLVWIFALLKATGCLKCSWWWVFSPVWIPILLALLAVG